MKCYRIYKHEPNKNYLHTGVGVGRNQYEALLECLENHMNAGDGRYYVGAGPGEKARMADPFAGVPFTVKNDTIVRTRGSFEYIQRFMDALEISTQIYQLKELLESLGICFIGLIRNLSYRNSQA